ncbi:MAG: CoA transferase [Pseudomonadales bacterium]
MLTPYRVIDLTGDAGMFCGYLLAHLGAEVISIEPPEGSSTRYLEPTLPGSDHSLWWEAYARGRTCVDIDIGRDQGRAAFRDLVGGADFVVHGLNERVAAENGLAYEVLKELNPSVIVVAITAFGASGPKAEWPASDLTVWASSGAHILAGDADRAPVRTSVPQTFFHAGADAAGAALIALYERHRSGLGQYIDVSAQQSSAQAALSAILATPNGGGMTINRTAGGVAGLFPIQLTWPCRDGYVAITFLFGPAFTEPNKRLLNWLFEYGACTAKEAEVDWGLEIAAMNAEGKSPEPYFALCKKIEGFTLARTQAELFEEGLGRGIYIAPTFDIGGLMQEPHFKARDFWHQIEVDGQSVVVPGAFAKFSSAPLKLPDAVSAVVPPNKVKQRVAPRPRSERGQNQNQSLAGLKVLDFMWVIAGPFFTRVLADYGATVIKVESSSKLEPARGAPTFKDGEPGIESGVPFANFNAGKLGITVDPSNPAGREVILDLVRWADVVTESFSPKAMRAWNLDYASLREVNPDIIMVSSCLMGQTGPRAQVPGYGNMAAAITGFYDLTGWSDRSPAGPYLAYTDGVSPRFMLASLLAALDHRRRTGQGQHIDLSQAEAALHLLVPAILDYQLNDHLWRRDGNRDLDLCPHGVYPARGSDRWIAIACQSDRAWVAFQHALGWVEDESLGTVVARRLRQDELDRRIQEWTATQDERTIEAILIDAGVAAHVVQNSPECWVDPQLAHRQHFVRTDHASLGEIVVEGSRFKLSRTPADIRRAGPELGEHNVHVLETILGYGPDQIADVFASMAME